MGIKFTKDGIFNVVKPLAIRPNKAGELQISQRMDGATAQIDPTTQLKYVERRDSKHIFLTPDGLEVIGHVTHFDPENAYNTGKKSEKVTMKETGSLAKQIEYREGVVARTRLELAKQEQKLAELRATIAVAPAPATTIPAPTPAWDNADARAEAKALLQELGKEPEPTFEGDPATMDVESLETMPEAEPETLAEQAETVASA